MTIIPPGHNEQYVHVPKRLAMSQAFINIYVKTTLKGLLIYFIGDIQSNWGLGCFVIKADVPGILQAEFLVGRKTG